MNPFFRKPRSGTNSTGSDKKRGQRNGAQSLPDSRQRALMPAPTCHKRLVVENVGLQFLSLGPSSRVKPFSALVRCWSKSPTVACQMHLWRARPELAAVAAVVLRFFEVPRAQPVGGIWDSTSEREGGLATLAWMRGTSSEHARASTRYGLAAYWPTS
jgi:hypothetical protein